MTLLDAMELMTYWAKQPPTHVILAAAYRVVEAPKEAAPIPGEAELRALVASFQGG